jgi:hypothetical protein
LCRGIRRQGEHRTNRKGQSHPLPHHECSSRWTAARGILLAFPLQFASLEKLAPFATRLQAGPFALAPHPLEPAPMDKLGEGRCRSLRSPTPGRSGRRAPRMPPPTPRPELVAGRLPAPRSFWPLSDLGTTPAHHPCVAGTHCFTSLILVPPRDYAPYLRHGTSLRRRRRTSRAKDWSNS